MDLPPSDFRLLRYCSDDYPVHLRLAAWKEILGRKLLAVEIEQLSEQPIQVDASLRSLGELRVGIGLFGPAISRRTKKVIAADNDDVFFLVNLEGPFSAENVSIETALDEGDAVFASCRSEMAFIRPTVGRLLCARLPRAPLAALVAKLDTMSGTIIRREIEPLRLFITYLRGLDDNQGLNSPELRRLVIAQVIDLAALVLNSASGMMVEARLRALGEARLLAIKSYITENLHHADLSINQVAAANKFSPRHVQRFFEAEGTTFSEFVLAKRLQRIHAALLDSRQRHRGISDIALSNGFGDVSHFNRAFRRHYGTSPSEVRRMSENWSTADTAE